MRRKIKQAFVLWCSLMLLVTSYTNGTLAWLFDITDPIVNTFTYGDINITLEETDDGDGNLLNNLYEMIPGNKIYKDPIVTVLKDSADCYLYVELNKSANFDDFMTFEIENGWNQLDGCEGIYYREVSSEIVRDNDFAYAVLKGNAVQVKAEVTKQQLEVLNENTYPTLKIKAYAIQRASMNNALEAWQIIKN